MIKEIEIPHTEQGMILYIRYGEAEIKKNERRNKDLIATMDACRTKLTQLGFYYHNNQWTKQSENKKGSQNAQHLQTV